jgi:hypothetical protein
MLREHLWLSSRPSEVADSTNKIYVGQELTANPIGTPYPDPLIRWYSFAHRFLSRHPLLRQSHWSTASNLGCVHVRRCGTTVVRSNPSAHRPANLNTEPRPPGRDTGTRSAFTTQSDRPKVQRGPGRCKQSGVILSLLVDLLQPDSLSSPVADTSGADSDHASAASTVPLLATLLSLIRGLRPDLPHSRRKVRSFKSRWPVPHLPTADTDLGKHRRESRT